MCVCLYEPSMDDLDALLSFEADHLNDEYDDHPPPPDIDKLSTDIATASSREHCMNITRPVLALSLIH